MIRSVGDIPFNDYHPETETLQEEVLEGLRQQQKRLPCKLLYDLLGSQLFDRICELPEYYPTRTELAIMQAHAPSMAAAIGERCALIEYGSGSSLKTRLLLKQLIDPAVYIPIDISRDHLRTSATRLIRSFPSLQVKPVCADYTRAFDLPECDAPPRRKVVYFPGSTIGNFEPDQAEHFLARLAEATGPDGGLLIGVDMEKDVRILEAAYNDDQGITAAFNLNILARLNRELAANFKIDQFYHHAFFNPEHHRIEMHLISRFEQTVHLGGGIFHFESGETICTEYSYKYSLSRFQELTARAGFETEQVWMDDEKLFSVHFLKVAGVPER